MRGSGELPVGLGVLAIALRLPRGDFLDQGILVGDASGETLAGQYAEFALGHVQPTAMLGRVMPFEPLDQATGLLGWEGFVERSWLVGAEVVLHQHDLAGSRKMGV